MSGVRHWLAVAAVVGGALAPIAGTPYRGREGRIDVARLAAEVAHEQDHVTALELAAWIRDREPGLRVIDLSTSDSDVRIPGSQRIALEALAETPFQETETIVLYSEGGAHAAQAWVFLRSLGHKRVYFLRGGLHEWIDEVLNPVLPAGATAEDAEAFERVSALSRYFGGVPRRDVAVDDPTITRAPESRTVRERPAERSTEEMAAEQRRRGC